MVEYRRGVRRGAGSVRGAEDDAPKSSGGHRTGETGSRVRSGVAPVRGLCRYLKIAVWHSEIFRGIPTKGQARLVYLHLLTGPHTLAYHVPGLYHVGPQALQEALELRRREFARAIQVLVETAGLQTDLRKGLFWLPSALDQMGPPANPNIVRGYCRALQTMPQSPLTSLVVMAYEPFLASLGSEFVDPLRRAFPSLCAAPVEDEAGRTHLELGSAQRKRRSEEEKEVREEPPIPRERAMKRIGDILSGFA